MRTIFMGSPAQVIPILNALREASYCELIGVISQPPKPAGRKRILQDPPVAEYAKKLNLKLWQPLKASSKEFIAELSEIKPDVVITSAYGQILSDAFIAAPKRAIFNIHPSMLPKYRGATPVQTALLNGDKKTGVTLLFTIKELDAGNIIIQEQTDILPDETAAELMPRLFQKSAELLPQAFAKLADPNFKGQPQIASEVTHSKKITKEDGRINWQESATRIFNRYRAYQPWPGVVSSFNGANVQFMKMDVCDEEVNDQPGSFQYSNSKKALQVATGKGTLLITRLKPEGRKDISAADFWNGLKDKTRLIFQGN